MFNEEDQVDHSDRFNINPKKKHQSPRLLYLSSKKNDLSKNKPASVPVTNPNLLPRYMSNNRKKKLEKILNNSIDESSKERIRNIVSKKLMNTFGTRNRGVIEAFVDEVVQKHDSISSGDLNRIQIELREILKHKKAPSTKIIIEELTLR